MKKSKGNKKMKSFLKWAAIVVGSLAVLFAGIQAYVLLYAQPYIRDSENAPTVDAILVLGAQVYKNDKPSPVLQDRLDYAYALYKAGKSKKIIVSGDHGTPDYDEVNTMKDYLLGKGVPRADIFLDHAGFDTYDSMYRAKNIFCVKSVLVCTQQFHMGRSLYIARRLGIEAYGVPAPDKAIYRMAYNQVRESLARVKSVVDVEVLKRPSKYLGDTIPVFGDGTVTDG